MQQLKDYQIKNEKGVYDKRNKINDLTGKEWLFSTRSVKTKEYSYLFNVEDVILNNIIDFVPTELISEIIATFTKSNSIVIDPNCNFGTTGIATTILESERQYYGYGYKKIKNLDISENFDMKGISFFSSRLELNNDFPILNRKILLISELIFSSLNSEERELQCNEFEKILKLSLNKLIDSTSNLDYVVIIIQNTKKENEYKNNSRRITKLLNSFNFNLKSEIIWKMPDSIFFNIKGILSQKSYNDEDIHNFLNDKRILVFRMN